MGLWSGMLGVLLTFGVMLGALLVRPAPARVLGVLGWPALLGLALWPLLTPEPDPSGPTDPLTIGFSNLFLLLGLLLGWLCSAPRRVRWPGEARRVSWGVGLLAAVALALGGVGLNALLGRGLPPEQRGPVTFGLVSGLVWSLLPAVAVAALVGQARGKAQA